MKKHTNQRTRRAARSSAAIASIILSGCGANGHTILSTRAATPTTIASSSVRSSTTSGLPATLPSFSAPTDSSVPSIERQLGAVV